MRLKPLGIKTVIISIALAAGMVVGTFGIGHAIAIANNSHTSAPVYPKNEIYLKNENGQTYGSAMYATSIDTMPDLIKARGVDGTSGYIRREDFNGVQPKTPKEALELQRTTPSIRKIPLYAVDGKTVIGTFIIKGNATEIKAEKKN